MYLSKIEIIGFKSFAQRINVSFDTGVTAIVGPNGCGKTNIVDAIRWALGEQRYSTLRSDKMEDVIFNGTNSRKPLGLAEVSLTIENSKGILPSEYTEVTITRRVFRSGESEYLLNKVPCRLKDILDLFMDTGMGSDAYSVIELKMVETILSDKTDERRKLFEEAAGVTKYKFRRKAAMRKLESVQQDLARVNDIVKEVQKTVGSLERQAKKAEQYNEVSTRLKALEIDLQEREYAYLHAKLRPLEEKFTLAQVDKSTIDHALRTQEEQIEALRSGLQEVETTLRESQQSVAAQLEAIHRVEEKILVANERLTSLTTNIARYEAEKTDLRQQEQSVSEAKVNLLSQKEALGSDLAKTELQFAQFRDEHHLLGKQVEARKVALQTLQDGVLTLAHGLVQQRGEQERVKARIDNLKGRIDRAAEETALYESDIAKNQELIAQLTEQDRDLRRKFVEAEMRLLEKEKGKNDLWSEIVGLQKQSAELRNEIERKLSRIDFTRRMMAENEGFSEGARYLLEHEPWKSRNLTTIADNIRTDERYRVAIEAALGEAAKYLIVESVDEGYAAFEELKSAKKGKATIVCLQSVPKLRRRGKKRMNLSSVWASTVVDCDDRYRALIDFLLDDVIIVDAPGVARDVFTRLTGVRCVTIDGQIIASHGVLRGGSVTLDEGGMIGKAAHIAELEVAIAQLEKELAATTTTLDGKRAEHEALALRVEKDAVKAVEKEMTAIEMRIAQLEFEKKRANDAIERNRSEGDALQREVSTLQQEFDAALQESAALEQQKAAQETLTNTAIREFETLDLQLAEKTKGLSELEIRVVTMQGDYRNLERDIERAEARIEDILLTRTRRDQEIERAASEAGRLTAEMETETLLLTELKTVLSSLDEGKATIERAYAQKRNELHQIELRIKGERRLHDDSVAATHDLEMKISELRSNIEHLRQRAKEEFELELQLKTYPEDEWVDFAHLRDEVKNLKDRIRVLGAINFAAFDEFQTESERLNFLTQQRDDLLEAEKTLLDTIEEINTTAQRIFAETFAKIRENFITIFKELFLEGDECDLKLEEGVDPLEARIEIIAKPRGKRPTSIDLLSGGEKTLTAIALLFAIYLVKPSPFCILDEVDAPLDDSNIDRYTRILKKFSGNTQFIVVTHNKRTMEAASALYGVTMEEEGVSKIVTVRFNEEARIRSAAVSG